MYPDFQYLFQSLFGTQMPEWLSIIKTFGFFVALSFIGAAWTTYLELKRKEKQGLLLPEINTIEIGKPASVYEILLSALGGFILGFKFGGLFGHWTEIAPNPLGYVFTLKGNLLVGLIAAAILGYSKYAEKKKEQLPQPEKKKIAIYPNQRMSEIIFLAAAGGFIGAKVFNALETWDDFVRDPAGSLFSSQGLTFYGGLIVATGVLYYYAKKHKIPFQHLCDATAPGLMLAYGVGRLGCHFSGDGDWGIYNIAYITNPDGSLRLSTIADQPVIKHLLDGIGAMQHGHVQYASYAAPGWLPQWLFAMNYPHNVNTEGMPIAGCIGNYCNVLPMGVFPTPIYESVICIGLFFVLWALRKRFKYALHLFGFYLIMNGTERFLVELIRVNTTYDWGFIKPTQAEIISVIMALSGAAILLFYKRGGIANNTEAGKNI